MTDSPLRLVVIVASIRPDRRGGTVADWFLDHARARSGLAVDVVDLATAGLPENLDGNAAEVRELSPRLAAADAFVVVVPEYNHSFPAPVKTAIDCFHAEWQAKPVGFVSYGGVSGGLRAVEQLRLVFAELHAVGIRDTVSFSNIWGSFDSDGRPVEPAGCGTAAKVMLDQLVWWATALRQARMLSPYGG